jgi:integrase
MGAYTRPDSKFWWIYLESNSTREPTAIPVGHTKEQKRLARLAAEARYHRRMVEEASAPQPDPDAKPDITFSEWATKYDDNFIAHHRGREREREILNTLREGFAHKPHGTPRLLREIDRELVIEWRTRRRSHGRVIEHFGGPKGPRRALPPPSARTVNREIDVLQQILAAAVPKYLARSPIEGLVDLEVTNPKRRIMTEAEEEKILPHLPPDDQAIVLCGLDTLARLSSILNLKRADDHKTHLTLYDTKNGQAYQPPISKRLRAALDAVPIDQANAEYYFPRRRRSKERDRRNAIAHALKRACAKAGVPYGRARLGITFHWATRRTGTTRMLRRGGEGAISAVQQIGGWKSANVPLTIYREVATPEMKALVELVGQRVKAPKDKKAKRPHRVA